MGPTWLDAEVSFLNLGALQMGWPQLPKFSSQHGHHLEFWELKVVEDAQSMEGYLKQLPIFVALFIPKSKPKSPQDTWL